jgi:hypothetical protein
MDALEQLILTGQIAVRTSRAAFVRPLVAVGLTAFSVPALAAVALVNFAHPLLSPIMVRVVTVLGSEWALHYPGSLVELSAMLGHLGRATEWLSLPLVLGWAGTLTAYGRRGDSAASALFTTLKRLPRTMVVGTPLVLVWGRVAGASMEALERMHRSLVSGASHFLGAAALEAAVLAVGASLLPVLVRSDLGLRAVPAAVRRVWRWGGIALPCFGAAMAVTACAGRIAGVALGSRLAMSRPDALLPVAVAAALVMALGLVVFAAASVLMATALDEGWQ